MIDLDLEFSDASFCLTDDDSIKSIADLVARPHLSGPVIESASIQIEQTFWLLRAPQNPEMSVGITPDQVDDIISVAVRHYDFVCIDLARTLEPIALRVMDRSDVVFPVMQTVLPFVRGMQRLQRTFRALHYPESKIQLVANRQGNKDDLPMTDIENALQAKFVVRLPNDFQCQYLDQYRETAYGGRSPGDFDPGTDSVEQPVVGREIRGKSGECGPFIVE